MRWGFALRGKSATFPTFPPVWTSTQILVVTNTVPLSVDVTPFGWPVIDPEVSLFDVYISAEN